MSQAEMLIDAYSVAFSHVCQLPLSISDSPAGYCNRGPNETQRYLE